MLIPADHIPARDGTPECFSIVTIMESPAVSLMALATTMTPAEVEAAKEDARRKLEAMATLAGAEVPAELVERLEAISTEGVHQAVVGEPFEVCWN